MRDDIPKFLEQRRDLEEVITDYLRTLSTGDPLDRTVYLRQHPHLADELTEFFDTQDRLDEIVGPLRDPVTVPPSAKGKPFGNYELLKAIGRGGMGVVYQARQQGLGRLVAVKMIQRNQLDSRDAVQRFQNEAEAAARLQHPHIVAIHEIGKVQEQPFFSMDYVEGQNLAELAGKRPMNPDRAARYLRSIAEAIHYAHTQGVLHRDLKPSNILIDQRDQVRITDFGLAKQLDRDEAMTQTGQILGTAGYMPPEQAEAIRDRIGPASDVYSMGVILYELLTGQAPFVGETLWHTLRNVREKDPTPPTQLNSEVPRDLEIICLKCLEKSPDKRYNSAAELAEDLIAYLEHRPIKARPISRLVRFGRWSRRNWVTLTLGSCFALIVLLSWKLNAPGETIPPEQPLANLPKPIPQSGRENDPPPMRAADMLALVQKASNLVNPFLPGEGKPNPLQQLLPPAAAKDQPAQLAEAEVHVEAVDGQPFGVCRIQVKYPGPVQPLLGQDQLVWLHEQNFRTLYPVSRITRQANRAPLRAPHPEEQNQSPSTFSLADLGQPPAPVQELTIYCLYQGETPLRLRVSTEDTFTQAFDSANHPQDPVRHRQLLQDWWREYLSPQGGPYLAYSEHPHARQYLVGTLARRLNLPIDASTGLLPYSEKFNSLLGVGNELGELMHLLLGTASIRAALQEQTLLAKDPVLERATEPLPKSVAPPAINLPPLPENIAIEPLAAAVPEECFYLRCRSYQDYRWFRQTLQSWGGNLSNLVTMSAVDGNIREKIEQQLAFQETATLRMFSDGVISDLAIIGTDPFFREGAAVGVLFQADVEKLPERANPLLEGMIREQRTQVARKLRLQESAIEFNGVPVSLLKTDDNSVRSFYVSQGNIHLITTSQQIASRFIEASQGTRSLAQLKEFQWARTKMPLERNDAVFLYLSDPFIRNLVGAHYRVEMTRRMRALGDMELVELALLTAAAEGVPATSVEELVDAGLLPANLLSRPDGAKLLIHNGRVIDSLRGAAGTFLPVPDMTIDKVTRSEATGYQQFSRSYSRMWVKTDPVLIAINRKEIDNGNRERLSLDVLITPYPMDRYNFLTLLTASNPPPFPLSRRILKRLPEDLFTLETDVHFDWFSDKIFHTRFSLQDVSLPYIVTHGTVVPFADLNWGDDESLEAWKNDLVKVALVGGPFKPEAAEMLRQNIGEDAGPLRAWTQDGGTWLAIAGRERHLDRLIPQLEFEEAEHPAQLRVRLANPEGAHIGELLRALTYMHARRVSSGNIRFVHQLMQQFHLDAVQARQIAEHRLLRGTLICPLGGEYNSRESESGLTHWRGTAWRTRSIYSIEEIPSDYRIPFLTWFQELEVAFSLTRDTIEVHVDLEITPPGKPLNPQPKVNHPPLPNTLLAEIQGNSLKSQLLEMLLIPPREDPFPNHRETIFAWQKLPPAEHRKLVKMLVSLLEGQPAERVCIQALNLILALEYDDAELLPAIQKVLLQASPVQQALALRVLPQLKVDLREAVHEVISLAIRSPDPTVRETAAQVLKRLDPAGDFVAPILEDLQHNAPEEEARQRAATLLKDWATLKPF